MGMTELSDRRLSKKGTEVTQCQVKKSKKWQKVQ